MPPSLPIPLVFRKPLSNHKNGAIFCIVFRIGGLLCSVLSSPSVGRTASPQIDRRDRVRPQGPGISFTDAEEEPGGALRGWPPPGRLPSGRLYAAAARVLRRRAFVLFGLELRNQILVGRAHDDRVELRAVIADETDALDVDIEDPPAAVTLEHAIVHWNLGPLFRDDARPDRGLVAVQCLAGIDDPFARIALDLRNVRALEEVSEQRDELRALARRPSLPVAAEAPLRDLREVENLVGDPAERGPTLRRLRVVLERGFPEDLQDAVDPAVELIGRWARPGA